MMQKVPSGFIRYFPYFSDNIKNNVNIHKAHKFLDLFNYNLEKTKYPIMYYIQNISEYESYEAIETKLRNKFENIKDSGIHINYFIKRYPMDKVVVDTDKLFYPNETNFNLYRNCLLTRIYYEKNKLECNINVLMEKGNITSAYMTRLLKLE
jgi:hypothetical protein